MSTSTTYGGTYTDGDHFRRAYEEIWGFHRANKRFQDQIPLPLENVEEVVSTERKGTVQAIAQENRRKSRSRTSALRRSLPTQATQLNYEARERGRSYRRSLSIVRRKMPPVRTKYVRLPPGRNSQLESFSSLWSYYFARLYRRYDSRLYGNEVPRSFQIRGVVEGTQTFSRALSNASLQELSQAWEALPYAECELLWPQVMLGALRKNPEWALKFLIATGSRPYAPSYAINDSLDYIVSHYLHRVQDPDAGSVAILFRTVIALLDNFDHYYLHLTQKTIFLLLSHINIDQAEHLYKTLVQRNHPIHENTLLQFAHAFARKGRTQLAVDILRSFHNNGGDFTQPKVESVCAVLLERKNRSSSDGVMSDSEIFGLLLDLGLRPNIIFYNILIRNAVESGNSGTAWQIHDMMPGLGINADANTYSILLNDAKLHMDRPTMERIVEIVESKGITNEYIITDLLHAMYLTYEQERREALMHAPPQAPLKRMLPLYAEYFNLEPMRHLLTQAYNNFALQSGRPKLRPSRETLVVMFIALLRGFTNASSAPEWYHRFRTMVLSGHPDIVPLAESTYIYDAVIMCLGRWPVTLHLCTKVIGDMLSSYSAAQKAQKRLDLPLRHRETLQTTMAYHPAFALPSNSTMKGLQKGDSGGGINGELNMASEKKSAAEFGEDVDAVDGYPSTGSKAADLSLIPSDIVSWSPTPDVEASKQSTDQAIIYGHCKPSVRTWSILLKAFMDHNQPRAAEKVLTMMRRQGITPNQVTWNSLAIGYARLQDIPNTVDVIERFENEGWEVDDITIKGLQVIENREALMEALQEKDRRRIKKLKAVEAAMEQQLDLRVPGGLDEVVHKAQLVDMYDQTRHGSSNAPKKSATHRQRRPRRLALREDEIIFLEKAHSTTRPQDENSRLVSSINT
jgi:pentatricopeptide repeat protein